MAKKKRKKPTQLQKKFQSRKKQLDRILKELGKDERIAKPKKLTSQYVESLKKIKRKNIQEYYSGSLNSRQANVIARRLTKKSEPKESENKKNKQIEQTSDNKIDALIFNGTLYEQSTGEAIEILDEEEFSQVHPTQYKTWFDHYYPKYNILNIDELIESYIDYIQIAKDRLNSVLELGTKGAQILRQQVNMLITKHGEPNFYTAISTMSEDFWESIDLAAHYGEDEIEMSGAEFRMNLDLIAHSIMMAVSELDNS